MATSTTPYAKDLGSPISNEWLRIVTLSFEVLLGLSTIRVLTGFIFRFRSKRVVYFECLVENGVFVRQLRCVN